MANKKRNNNNKPVQEVKIIQPVQNDKPDGKRFWRTKVHINGYGAVQGEVTEDDFKAFSESIPKGVEIDFNRWCITESEQKAKENIQKEKKRLAKA